MSNIYIIRIPYFFFFFFFFNDTATTEIYTLSLHDALPIFVDAVNRISATESLDDEVLDRSGFPTKRESRTFSYVASIQESSPGLLRVDEYRNGSAALDLFPEHIATLGLTSLALIFHPMFKDDYDFSCEGLSRWRDGLAWQVHFRQNPQKPARMRGYRTGDQFSPV